MQRAAGRLPFRAAALRAAGLAEAAPKGGRYVGMAECGRRCRPPGPPLLLPPSRSCCWGPRAFASSSAGSTAAAEPAAGHAPPEQAEAEAASAQKSTARRQLHPPGKDAPASKAEKFARLVVGALESGEEVELTPVGAPAMWHSLRALCVGPSAAEIEVAWGVSGRDKDPRRPVHVLARTGMAWKDFNAEHSGGLFVSNSTQASQLAKKLAMELRGGKKVVVHTFEDAEVAVAVILKALAIAVDLTGRRILCAAGSQKHEGETVARILLNVWLDEEEEEGGEAFVAYPPGTNASEGAVKRFEETVRQRMEQGTPVVMECRGREASTRAVKALAAVRRRVACFEVQWVDGYTGPPPSEEEGTTDGRSSPAIMRALQLRAVSGETWDEFNATDFGRTRLLKASSSSVKNLSKAIGTEVRKLGAVALHAYADNHAAVFSAVKAVASVPTECDGLRVACVPSFGWAQDGSGGRTRSLRFFIRAAAANRQVPKGSQAPRAAN